MVYVAYPKDIKRLACPKQLGWVYIGSHAGLESARKGLDYDKRRFVGKFIKELTESLKTNFVDFIGQISQQQKDRVLWYSSRIASKSVSQTTVFSQYVYLKLLERLTREPGEIIFITDDTELLRYIRKMGMDNIKVLSRGLYFDLPQLRKKMKDVSRMLEYFIKWTFFKIFIKKINVGEADVLVHGWIDARVFGKNGEYRDPFFGGLCPFLIEKGYVVKRLAPLNLTMNHILRLRKGFKNIVYPLSYLRFFDLLKVYFTRFSVKVESSVLRSINDLDILLVLLKNEEIKENATFCYKDYLLWYFSYKNLSRSISDDVSVIYPFENQPWEKMLNLALVDKCNMIGYLNTIIPVNWLDYAMSTYEKNAPMPHVILTVGKKWSDFIRRYCDNAIIVEEAGAIRFSYILNTPKVAKRVDLRNILVALPIFPELAISLQEQVLSSLDSPEFSGYQFSIKSHPYLPQSALLTDKFSKYKNCRFTDAEISHLLKDCCLMVTSGSTVAFESVFSGIRTVYLIPDRVSDGSEFFITDHLFIAHEEDFKRKMNEALGSSCIPDVPADDYFSHPDYSVFTRNILECKTRRMSRVMRGEPK